MSRIKKLPNTADHKSLPSIPANSSHVLSLDDLENAHKVPGKVKEIYIKDLGGIVYSRPVSADVVESFLELTTSEDKSVPQIDLIRTLSEFASAALCNKDGSDFLSLERAKKLSVETLSEICAGIATGGARKGKGSRR